MAFGDDFGSAFGADFGGDGFSLGGGANIGDAFGPAGPDFGSSGGFDFGGGISLGDPGQVGGFDINSFGLGEDDGGGFFSDLIGRMDPRTEEGFMAAAAGPFGTLVHVIAALQRQFPGLEVTPTSPSDFTEGEGDGAVLVGRDGRRVVLNNAGEITSSDIPEIEPTANTEAFDISSLEGTFVPTGQGSGLQLSDLPPLPDPTGLEGEEALQYELRAISRAALEVSLEQRDIQQALLPQLLRGAGANPILGNDGKLIGFEIPKGGFPVPPGIERDIETGRATRMEQLRRQLGPGFETSTPGIEAIEEFEFASTMARDIGRSQALDRISSTLGLPIQTAQNISSTGGGATSSLSGILSRSSLSQQDAFNRGRLALAGEDDDIFGTIFGGLARGIGAGIGGAAYGGLFG